MRWDFKTAQQHTSWDEMLAVWNVADELDVYTAGWTFDHFYPIFSDSSGPCFDGWVALSALAQATTRLRLGVMVTGTVYRHPAVLANMATTVDHLSHGRLELGLGTGWNDEECVAYGIEFGSLGERFDRFDEACRVIVSLLTNELTDFRGAYYSLRSARCEPKPVQRPHPPICIGGTGERRTLRAVARWAQHWNLPNASVDEFVHKRHILHEHCAAIGRDQAAGLAEAGLDSGIIRLEPPFDPGQLETVASALRTHDLM